ncbi:MAG: hypothetical protein Q7S53_02900 [bacterium]|nr:hypothetical protein [bacterium]
MAGFDAVCGIGVIYVDSYEKELVGKAISALRYLGVNNALTQKIKYLLMSKYGLKEAEAVHALILAVKTHQVSFSDRFWNLNEDIIQKYGYDEHKLKHSVTASRRVSVTRPLFEGEVPVPDGMEVLEQILTVQRNNTMQYMYCRRSLKNKGLRSLEIDELFVKAKKEGLITCDFGRVTWKANDITTVEPTEIPGYTIKREAAE